MCLCAQLLQSCPTVCDPMDCRLQGSSVIAILQATILEWVAMPSSRGSSQPKDGTHISCTSCIEGVFITTELPGMPHTAMIPPNLKTALNALSEE